MEIVIQLLDELDDLFGPLFSMATAADYWRTVCIAGAVAAGLVAGSAAIFLAGMLLAAAGELLPRRDRSGTSRSAQALGSH